MAENITFPISFDLDAAVKKASQDWNGTYAAQLEKAIQKRALEIKLKVSPLNFDSLEAVKHRLAQLKIEPVTPETKTAIRELANELKTLAKALEQVQKYSISRSAVNPDAVRAARISEINQRTADKAAIAIENQRAAAARAAAAEERLAIARNKSAQAAMRATSGVNNLTAAYNMQSSYIGRLIQRTSLLFGIHQIASFAQSLREVTAQFELQRVSLGAIIQDQTRANALFSEIKQFAIKSPVSIIDLTKYTKQVAAYRIETDKLFDTTKRLADVSVGLGVDMGRLVLAYGQVKAASYLRAAEIRQFTEAGIPMLELLAEKFTKLNGEMVSTEQVMDMVSKRGVSFSMVEEIFNDMTSAGGMFYNMQEKQGNTLLGMWAKLGDAASIMYDEIGNTESINAGMKGTIELMTDLMKNWREVGRAMLVAGVGIAGNFAIRKVKGWQGNINAAKIAANEKYIASSNVYRTAIHAEQIARATATVEEYKAIAAKTTSAEATYAAARAEYLAARNTTLWSKAWEKLKTAFLGNWINLLIAGLASLGLYIYNAYEKANRLKNALKEVKEESVVETEKSTFNFEMLAKKAVEAADGSKEQREALQELQNTYKNIIPIQELTIENLKELRGNYEAYTRAIRENIAVQSQQQQMNLVVEEYAKTIREAELKLKKEAKGVKITLFDTDAEGKTIEKQIRLSNEQIDRYVAGVKYFASNTDKSAHEIRQLSLHLFVGLPEKYKIAADAFNYFDGANSKLISDIRRQDVELSNIQNSMSEYTASMGIFGDRWKKVADNIANTPIIANKDSYLAQRKKDLVTINEYISALKDNFAAVNIEWKDSYATIVKSVSDETTELSTIDFSALKEAVKKEGGDYAITLGNVISEAEKNYNNLVPTEDIVNSLNRKLKAIALNTGASMDKMQKYLISGNDNIKDKLKSLTDSFDEITEQIYKFEQYNAKLSRSEMIGLPIPTEKIEALKEESKALALFLRR